jgi:regulator of sigma E protease
MLDVLQNILLYGGSFIFVLGLVIFVHEYGHFKAGRLCRVAVKSFAIGFGSTLVAKTDRHNTTWKLCAIPLGGFVSWVDDTDPSSAGPATAEHQRLSREEARARGHFRAQPVAVRAFVTAAGPAMNFIFAILAFALVFLIAGQRFLAPSVGQVERGSAAERAGLRGGDSIIEINGRAIGTFDELQKAVQSSPGQTLHLRIRRGGETLPLQATPVARRITEPTGESRVVGMLGFRPRGDVVVQRYGPIGAFAEAGRTTWGIIATTGVYVANIFTGKASGEHIAGPLGILKMSGDVASNVVEQPDVQIGELIAELLLTLVKLAAVLSVAVGIANLLPIPILDGWHLLLYGIEAVRGGRQVPQKVQEWAVPVGLLALALLLLFATSNDIRRILG